MPAIGRYAILRKIADGGMAELYLGMQHGAAGFARPVVIKAIRRACSADPQFRNVLVDEAHIAMSLTHSNIVQVLDLGVANGRYFLILELVDGWDLERIRRRAEAAKVPLPPALALHIVAEVCRALAYAHARTRDGKPLHIVHRDVSPQNILISEQGEVKLTDFGIATATERRERTATGLIKGKVGFMSPEQASGAPLDARSDLFALGTVLYQLATGRQPFASATELETLLRTKEARYPPPEEVAPQLAPEVAEIIRRAMQREPDARYASAEEMLARIEKVMRSALEPVGQSELKRWLAELSEHDRDMPIGKLSVPALEVSDDEILSAEGKELALTDVDVSAPRKLPPPAPEPTPLAGSAAPPRARRGRPLLLAVAALAVLAGVAATQRDRLTMLIAPATQPASPVLARVDPRPAVAPAPPSEALMSTSLPAADAGELPQDAGTQEPSDSGAVAASEVDAGLDAGALAVADLDGGLDAGAVAAAEPPAPAHEAAHDARPSPARVLPEGVVSVKFVTDPAGAEVRVDKRPLGTTPVSLRFRSGLAYQVRFELSGYEPEEQRVFVSGRKNQVVQSALKRSP